MTQFTLARETPDAGYATCPRCHQLAPIRDWCLVADHTYTVEDKDVVCPGSGMIQHQVSRGHATAPVTSGEKPPTKRNCNSCGGSGKVKNGRDKQGGIIWVTCSSCSGAGKI